jgi:hypothetical protein
MGLLNQVRAHAAAVAEAATYVRIEHTTIDAYAHTLPLERLRAPELDAATHYLAEPEGTLAYLVQLDAINFGSGYFPRLRKRPGMSGYFTVAASLKDVFESQGPIQAGELQKLTLTDTARIFGQDRELADPAVAELMGLFARALNDLGGYVEERFGGSFRPLVDAADGSAERLAGILAEMPFYRDVGFYKRAQLTAADLATAGVAEFRDLDRLTIFADNLVPHVLRVDGILSYDPELLERINREELIPKGSREELEIRAAALHAVELIAKELSVTPMQLDYLLWNRGQEAAYKALPRHRTRTVFY